MHKIEDTRERLKHLDVVNVTLCNGSRHPDGCVPYVYLGGGKVGVRWCSPGNRGGDLRTRVAVS